MQNSGFCMLKLIHTFRQPDKLHPQSNPGNVRVDSKISDDKATQINYIELTFYNEAGSEETALNFKMRQFFPQGN